MMKRFVSIWLSRWETNRFFRAHRKGEAASADGSIAFALIESGAGGERLCALTSVAQNLGLSAGNLLTDARALAPGLQTAPREFEAARDDLKALTLWCERYTPFAAVDPPDGIMLDITGCAHLFGGEEAMLAGLADRMHGFALQARIASADTPGAAFAMARFGKASVEVVPPGAQKDMLASLPVAALRIEPRIADQLHKLGLKTIGQFYDMPRSPMAARFGESLLRRLDQALGREDEAISPLIPVRNYSVRSVFPEPISLLADIEHIARDLAFRLCPRLEGDGRGAKSFALKLFGTDGSVREISVSSAQLLFKAEKLAALFHERIHGIEAFYDPGTGVDALSLEAARIESLESVQKPLGFERDQGGEAFSFLLDRLSARLGPRAIGKMSPRESHVPERAQRRAGLDDKCSAGRWRDAPRPLLLLPHPEPIAVMAEIPDGPPAQFVWRRIRLRVAFADGPERIAQEWWRDGGAPTRDYFRIEDEEHRRYWLYRDGLYGIETGSPRWYMHGLFP